MTTQELTRECRVAGCGDDSHARGLCRSHYNRLRRKRGMYPVLVYGREICRESLEPAECLCGLTTWQPLAVWLAQHGTSLAELRR